MGSKIETIYFDPWSGTWFLCVGKYVGDSDKVMHGAQHNHPVVSQLGGISGDILESILAIL